MDIKLRARLSAYSKVDSLSDSTNGLPDTSLPGAEGALVGVGSGGNFTLFPAISNPEIDTLFNNENQSSLVTKDEIDTLFTEEKDPSAVSKDEIDELFETTEEENTITRVSYAEIDSLFS